jgi:adenosyl cobinamide kinase/adenosyl cobinamide phosphate guanylyltransferase
MGLETRPNEDAMAKKQSKYKYDSRLFSAEPPEDDDSLKKLFCGRKLSLRKASETLEHNMDIKGERNGKKPWIIVGESRSGKSHLARHLFGLLKKRNSKKPFYYVVIPAREKLESREVVRVLFERIREIYIENRPQLEELSKIHLQNDPFIEMKQDAAKSMFFVDEIIQRITELLEQNVDSLEINLTAAQTKTLQAQASSGIPFISKLFKILGGASWTTQTTEGKKLTFRQPSISDLIGYCSDIIELLAWFKRLDHILILVDDVDLLEGYRNPEQNGATQRNRLTDALIRLHQTPHIDVLLTARSWYGQTHKELEVLVDLAMTDDLNEEHLKEIHDKHFALFGKKSLPSQFLQEDALQTVTKGVSNLPGVFLRFIKTAFEQYKQEEVWGTRELAWLRQVYSRRFSHLRDTVPLAAQAIKDALQDDRFLIDVQSKNHFLHTTAMDEFVYQSYFSETTYFIPPIMQYLLGDLLNDLLDDKTLPPNREEG